MNVNAIFKLADVIEQAGKDGKQGFNMGTYGANALPDRSGHQCGTVACVAGWQYAISANKGRIAVGGIELWSSTQFDQAMMDLGLTHRQAGDLFLPNNKALDNGTPKQAAMVLRILALTGKVRWSAVYYRHVKPEEKALVTKYMTERELAAA